MNCPVCNKADISLDKPTCPECGSDLEAVSLINRLDESLKKIRKNLTIVAIIAAVIIIVCMVRLYTLYQARTEANVQIEKYKKEISSLNLRIDSLNNVSKKPGARDTKKENTENSGGFKSHVVKSGDSLWKLAQQYLGDGNKYLKIATDNNLQQPYLLREGQELKINTQ